MFEQSNNNATNNHTVHNQFHFGTSTQQTFEIFSNKTKLQVVFKIIVYDMFFMYKAAQRTLDCIVEDATCSQFSYCCAQGLWEPGCVAPVV